MKLCKAFFKLKCVLTCVSGCLSGSSSISMRPSLKTAGACGPPYTAPAAHSFQIIFLHTFLHAKRLLRKSLWPFVRHSWVTVNWLRTYHFNCSLSFLSKRKFSIWRKSNYQWFCVRLYSVHPIMTVKVGAGSISRIFCLTLKYFGQKGRANLKNGFLKILLELADLFVALLPVNTLMSRATVGHASTLSTCLWRNTQWELH